MKSMKSMQYNDPFTGMNFGMNFNNFNPEELQTDETINAVFVVDVSPSIQPYVNELNQAFNDFIQEMQHSHIADRLLISVIEFCENVNIRNGFQPIVNVPRIDFVPQGSATALYDASELGLKNAVEYRKNLVDSGVNCKTLFYVLTDGMDNVSKAGAESRVKKGIEDFLQNEKNVFSFTSILFGIGDLNRQHFEAAKDAMGIQLLATIKNDAKEIRKMINWISSSISSTASGQKVSAVNF